MPLDVECRNTTQSTCTAWQAKRLTADSCDLRRMCMWRYVLAAARGVGVMSSDGASAAQSGTFEEQWRVWGRRRSATDIFEVPPPNPTPSLCTPPPSLCTPPSPPCAPTPFASLAPTPNAHMSIAWALMHTMHARGQSYLRRM